MEFPFATLGRRWVMRIPSDSQIGAQLTALKDDQAAFNIAVATAYDSLVAVGITPETKESEVIEKLASLNGSGRTEVAILEPNPIKETIMDALRSYDVAIGVLHSACFVTNAKIQMWDPNTPTAHHEIRSGVGDGVYAIVGLSPNTWSQGSPATLAPFRGFMLDFRQDVLNSYIEDSAREEGQFLPRHIGETMALEGHHIINVGSLHSDGQISLSDVNAQEYPFPVRCDLKVEPGRYHLFAVLDKFDALNTALPKFLLAIHRDYAGELLEHFPFDAPSVQEMVASCDEEAVFMLTGDHKTQCYCINAMLAYRTNRIDECISWCLHGIDAGDEESKKLLNSLFDASTLAAHFDFSALRKRREVQIGA